MPPSDLTLRAAQTGEHQRTWAEIYECHFDKSYRLILHSGVPASDAEDLAQRVFIVAQRRLSEAVEVENVGAWVRGITLNVVSEYFRWRRVRTVKAWLLGTVPGATPASVLDPEQDAERIRLRRRITSVLGSMSPKLRDVLVLIEIEGLKPQEAAKVLNCPVNTVRSRRRLAVEDFQRRWRTSQPEPSHVE